MLPTFIIGGAQKAGTTALHWRLKSHPEIHIPDRPQEIHFFDDERNYARGLEWYEDLFAHNRGLPAVGQTSPRYIYDPNAPSRIRDALPGVRLVFLLRNPVDRAYSHYWHSVKLGYESLSFEEAIEREPERILRSPQARRDFSYLDRGRYAEQLSRFLAFFPRSQLLLIRYEDLSRDADTVDRACAHFLSVAPDRFPARSSSPRESNTARLPRIDWIQRLTRHVRERAPYLVAAIDHLNLRPAAYPPMAADTRAKLLDRLRPETERLEQIVDMDLSSWRR